MTRVNKVRCLSKRKDTNFKANHNQVYEMDGKRRDVCLSAKIRILKQITTTKTGEIIGKKMFV